MSKYKDLTGLTFGKLTAIKMVRIDNKVNWECNCSCGGNKTVPSKLLLSNKGTKSCGCARGGYKKSNVILELKVCKHCDTQFRPERKTDKFCSSGCSNEYYSQAQKSRKYNSQTKEYRKNAMAEWRSKNPAKNLLSSINQRDNIDIDEKWIQDRLDKGVCEVTGIEFEKPEYGTSPKGFNHYPWNPSIDKINPSMGYRKDNCQMVVWAYNRAKGIWDEDIMVKLAKGMYDGLVR